MTITIAQGAFFPVPPALGGAVEKIWFDLGRQFASFGHTVYHVSRTFSGYPTREIIEGVHHLRVKGYSAPKFRILYKLYDLIYSGRVARVLRRSDILVTHTFWLPVLVRNKQFGKLYVHVARFPKGQLRLYRNVDRLQTVSSAVALEMRRQAPELNNRIHVVPYPIELPKTTREDGDLPMGQSEIVRILYAGRVHPEKGLDLFLDSLSKLSQAVAKSVSVQIVGPWEVSQGGGGVRYSEKLKKVSRKLRVEVEWVGPIFDRAALGRYYQNADIFLYPSVAAKGESFGVAPLEAMAHGCAVVVSSLDCFTDFIEHRRNGVIFDHTGNGASTRLAETLTDLVLDEKERKRLGRAARIRAEGFSLRNVSEHYIRDFEELLRAS